MDVTALHPADQTQAYRELFEQVLETEVLRATTLRDGSQIHLVTQRGRQIPVELHARTIDVEGESWVYTIARDITERYERERELEQKKDRFEKFSKVVSHDLRNPLNIADGRVALARGDCDSEHLDEVAAALDRMESLIGDLLELASEGDRESVWVDLAEVSEHCWENVETDATSINVETEQTIRADRSRLQQLFENLIRNSVEHGSTNPRSRAHEDSVEHGSTDNRDASRLDDATEHGGDGVTITVGDLDEGFYVEDDGPGIAPTERDRVFEVGYSSTASGTGFGLDIVKQVATEHGWDVSVTDGTNGGARFEITNVESTR